jgi:valyl-tRNA synthetase
MATELPKTYDPRTVEARVNDVWTQQGYFHAQPPTDGRDTYTIVIPPPNVTAALHLGHALNNTLQDVLIRFRRMQQLATLWMPGTDHAGIATQTVVEKRILAEEGKRRTDFTRAEFVGRVQAWKDEYEKRILGQLQAMGCSCDWERTRFTMDAVCARAVRATFFKLFKDGLIYRGKRLVNWDPATQTVLADDEVEHESVAGHFWYLRYPLVNPVTCAGQTLDHVTVAPTRPETMLGDTAVAMNPGDPRANALVGQQVRLPIVGRLIPLIADEHVVLPDPESEDEKARFSTGFLKVTPAHDPDDWQIGQRHALDIINVMAPDGSISDRHGWEDATLPEAQSLLGMDRFEAREAIVEWFRQENLLAEVREYTHEVGHSYRSHVPIEPYLSDQWYVAVKQPIEPLAGASGTETIPDTDVPVHSLAGLALQPLVDGRLRFIPERYGKTYHTWLANLRDWPISRQLWWGHQIPVWSKPGTHAALDLPADRVHVTTNETDEGPVSYLCVGPDATDIEQQLEAAGWQRDPDVLDTWFSSALWPFSTMGWPEDTPEVRAFYPGNVLCTAREIITLWVSRMVMMGQYCVGDIPYRDVYIHAMIQDGQGRKMSKSLGNGIDPLVAIESHGADAMRFTLASMTTDTQDIRMPVKAMTTPDGREINSSPKFDLGRNFCNKLWNASRFAMMNLDGTDPGRFEAARMDTTDQWILSRLASTIHEVTAALDHFKFSEPLNLLYRFFWNDLCDWYLEWAKPRMQDPVTKPIAQNVLAAVLDQTLRMLHPFLPFITEGIFENLNSIVPHRGLSGLLAIEPSNALAVARWPEPRPAQIDASIEQQIETVQTVIRTVREIRSARNIPPGKPLKVSAKSQAEMVAVLTDNSVLIQQLAVLETFTAQTDLDKPAHAAVAVAGAIEVYVHDAVDPATERTRLEKQRQMVEKAVKGTEGKLANENFLSRAKPEVVEQARAKLVELKEQLEAVERNLKELDT